MPIDQNSQVINVSGESASIADVLALADAPIGLPQDPPVDGSFITLVLNQATTAGTFTGTIDLKSYGVPAGAKIAFFEVYSQISTAGSISTDLEPLVNPSILGNGSILAYIFTGNFAGEFTQQLKLVPLVNESFEYEITASAVGNVSIYLLGWL